MKREQIEEWAESPVTRRLLEIVAEQISDLESGKGVHVYHPFEPQKTQETLARLNGECGTWTIVADLLSGDWSFFEEEESDE